MTTPDQAMFELAQNAVGLGDELEADILKGGPILGFLLGKAKAEAARALVAMLNAEPSDVAAMRRMQGEALRFHEIAHWLRDAVTIALEERELIESLTQEELAALVYTPDQKTSNYEDD